MSREVGHEDRFELVVKKDGVDVRGKDGQNCTITLTLRVSAMTAKRLERTMTKANIMQKVMVNPGAMSPQGNCAPFPPFLVACGENPASVAWLCCHRVHLIRPDFLPAAGFGRKCQELEGCDHRDPAQAEKGRQKGHQGHAHQVRDPHPFTEACLHPWMMLTPFSAGAQRRPHAQQRRYVWQV